MADGTTPPRPRRSRKSPSAADSVEIDRADDSRAQRTLLKQEQLIETQVALGRWQIASERAGFALKVATGAMGLAVVLVLATLIWSASRADGLVIRPFSVPPALAAQGVTGEAVAAQIMDRLGAMAETAQSGEAQQRVAAARHDDISIQIPETGISLSQLDQWLKEKFGHERRVTGELMIGADGGLVLASRDGAVALPEQRGQAKDLPVLLQGAAEALFEREQPTSYGFFLRRTERLEDYRRFLTRRMAGDAHAKAEAYVGLSLLTTDLREQRALAEKAMALDANPSNNAISRALGAEQSLGRLERALHLNRRDARLLDDRAARRSMSEKARLQYLMDDGVVEARHLRDWGGAFALSQRQAREQLLGVEAGGAPELFVVEDLANLHEVARVRRILEAFQPNSAAQARPVLRLRFLIAMAAEDWPQAWLAYQARVKAWEARTDKGAYYYVARSQAAAALIALGRLAEAQAMLQATPLDCMPCVASRGELAEAMGDRARADHWLGEAVRIAPSLPEGPYRWGLVLLARGDSARAISQFQAAHARGPRWADPLERWGEALLKAGDAKAAADKFDAAARLAPRWGRLRLKWGEALARLGQGEEARMQWRMAAKMDLTAAERAKLQALLQKRTP